MTDTPLEWSLERAGFEGSPVVIARRADGSPMTICVLGNSHATDNEANARLIAAAPDMLAALKLF